MVHFTISCDSCVMDGTAACADCVVTHLLAPARREPVAFTDDGSPVYSLGTGFGVPAGKHFMIGVDYRYVAAFDRTTYNYDVEGVALAGSFKYRSHFVGLSLRYSFGSALADSHPVEPVTEPTQVVPVSN